ncbi:MAG: branched-chain amino acid ABC transporter permease [Acidiferrobacteraceae bacterium]
MRALPKGILTGAGTVILFILLPHVYENDILLFNLMMYMALAQGVNVLYGFTGYLPFGYVGFFGAGAYGTALSIRMLHLPALAALGLGGLASVVVGLLFAPLLRLSGAYFSIASLAASEALYQVVSNPHLTRFTRGPYGMSLASVYAPRASYNAMAAILALAIALVVYLRASRKGLALRAIRDDAVAGAAAGIPVVRLRVEAWLASALLAGLSGGAFAWHLSVFYPETVFNLGTGVFAIVFALFGGLTIVTGPIIGTLVLYGLYNWIGITEPQYFDLAFGVAIVLLALFLPDGLASLLRQAGMDLA